jgi:hypothetical protein
MPCWFKSQIGAEKYDQLITNALNDVAERRRILELEVEKIQMDMPDNPTSEQFVAMQTTCASVHVKIKKLLVTVS